MCDGMPCGRTGMGFIRWGHPLSAGRSTELMSFVAGPAVSKLCQLGLHASIFLAASLQSRFFIAYACCFNPSETTVERENRLQ